MVNEVFSGLQGEGKTQGQFRQFIRLNNCNLTCKFCFGLRPGRRDPKLLGPISPVFLSEIKQGDVILTYDDNLQLVETTVTKVIKRQVDIYYEVKINNTLYYVTPEHPFFTTRGLVEMENLKIGDFILHSSWQEHSSWRMQHYNPMFNEEVAKKSTEHTDYTLHSNFMKEKINKQKEEGTYVSTWDKLSAEQKEVYCNKLSELRKKEKNPNWAGYYDKYKNYFELKEKCASKQLVICAICNRNKKLEVHHIDENHENDDPSNLMCVCHSCHSKIHSRGYSFWLSERKDGKRLKRVIELNGYEVQSIKKYDNTKNEHFGKYYGPKPLNVINISCSPYNTYLIDYMWVHNCDTKYTWGKGDAKVTLPKKLNSSIVISGGEPTLRDNLDFIKTNILNKKEVTWVEIETNGTQELSKQELLLDLHKVNLWNISPKNKRHMNRVIETDPILLNNIDCLSDYIVKFIVDMRNIKEDTRFIKKIQSKYKIPNNKIWVMPLTINSNEEFNIKNSEFVYDYAFNSKYNFSARLHVLIKGNQRGL